MQHPPYHLRVNKAVDRAAFVEAMAILAGREALSKYTYCGMGGPFLEDHRLLHELYPEMRLVSIEQNEQTYKRQQFHRPCSDVVLELRRQTFQEFVHMENFGDDKYVVWADYTDLSARSIETFTVLLQRLARGSMVKITLRAHAGDYRCEHAKARFRQEFAELIGGSIDIPIRAEMFVALVQRILRTAIQRAFREMPDHRFQPVSALFYRDTIRMYTLTGVICSPHDTRTVEKKFADWRFANTQWASPLQIDLPVLTTRERHHLRTLLPCVSNAEDKLQEHLGYFIDTTESKSKAKLQQWALFHRYAVEFVKASP